MKKFLKVLLIIIVIWAVYCGVEYYRKDNIYEITKKNVAMFEVKENSITCEINNGMHLNSWNYKYEIKDRNLYLTVYRLSFINPMTVHSWLGVNIDVGYNDLDNIYIDNGEGTEKILIWRSRDVFTADKLSNLNVTRNEFSCNLDYEYWDYEYDLVSKILYIDIREKKEKNENGLEVKIDKGYDEFNEVRIFGLGNNVVIWSK